MSPPPSPLLELLSPGCGPLNHVAQELHEVAEGDGELCPWVTPTTGLAHPPISATIVRFPEWAAGAGAQGSGRVQSLSKHGRGGVTSDLGHIMISLSFSFF